MSTLRQRMTDDMRLRNFSPRTIESYLFHVAAFAKHFATSPDALGAEHVRAYQLHLFEQKRASPSTVNLATCALKFFFRVTLGRCERIADLPIAKRGRKLPVVLSPNEVLRLLEAVRDPLYRILLTTAYSAGLRLSEVLHLRVEDIDSERMTIRVRQGKGRKDRYVMLSPVLLESLRGYWKQYRPRTWLFPATRGDRPVSETSIQRTIKHAAREAGIAKPVCVRTLRHCFATHLLETGTDIHVIQQLLGHTDVRTTQRYAHVSTRAIHSTPSPLDLAVRRTDEGA